MFKDFVSIFLIQIVILLEIIFILMFIIKLNKAIKYERRITKFSVTSNKEKDVSYLDRISNIFSSIIKAIANAFEKSNFFKKRAEKFRKHKLYSPKPFVEYLITTYVSACLLGLIVFLVTSLQQIPGVLIYSLIAAIIGYIIPSIYWDHEYSNYLKSVSNNILEAIIIINSSVANGSTLIEAITFASNQLNGPINEEIKKIEQDLSFGLSLDQGFNRFHERINANSLKYINAKLSLYKMINGDYNKAFQEIEKYLYNEKENEKGINILLVIVKKVVKFLLYIPILLLLIFFIIKDGYFTTIFGGVEGYFTLSIIALIYVIYLLQIKKVLGYEV